MKSIQDIADTIEQVLRPVESIDYAFLFGSATGSLLPGSDIDILLGGDVGFDQRLFLTAALSRRLRRDVDIVPVKEARSQLVAKAMSKGVLIFAKTREALKQDYSRNWRAYDDSAALRRMRIERIKEQYGHGR
jgi:predicted nucleotidyltransferase